jgi:hypothetical protein
MNNADSPQVSEDMDDLFLTNTGLPKSSNSITASSSMAKYESGIKKIYENALKSIKQSGRNKIFTVLYFSKY